MTGLDLHALCLRCVALTIAAASFITPTWSAELTRNEVQSAVETWVRSVTADARADAAIVDMEPYVIDGETVAYVAHLSDAGFCLCGADDRLAPVYLYCPNWKYDPNNPEQRCILDEIAARRAGWYAAMKRDDPALPLSEAELADRAAYWQALIAGDVPPDKDGGPRDGVPDTLVLPLTCEWGQGSPYNDQCPNLTPGEDERVKVGCVAIAMAQTMYYWKWPETGAGSGAADYSYFWRDDWDGQHLVTDPNIPAWWNDRLMWTPYDGGTLWMNGYWDLSMYLNAYDAISNDPAYQDALTELMQRGTWVTDPIVVDFGAATYDWSLMADVHTDPPDAGDAEAAQLCYHAAVAIDMFFGLFESSAHTNEVPGVLTNNFRYDSDATYGMLDIPGMVTEILWLRPIIFRARDPNKGGHAWVVYGYNHISPTYQFMMNFGWKGFSNGWYTCDNIDPPGYLFSDNPNHVTRLAPEGVVRFVGAYSPGDGTPNTPYWDITEAAQEAPDDVTLIFKAGSVNTFAGGLLTIDRPMTLKGYDITILPE